MKALRQLGFLKLNFRQDVPSEEEDRVLTLFRNRAELKKAYGELQDEVYRLKDRIKQQEGATQRVQEMLNALETRLGVTDTGYPALVFYQLRRLWQSGRELIEQFVADLVAKQDERTGYGIELSLDGGHARVSLAAVSAVLTVARADVHDRETLGAQTS